MRCGEVTTASRRWQVGCRYHNRRRDTVVTTDGETPSLQPTGDAVVTLDGETPSLLHVGVRR
ncbi:MAG: hypothetical protein J6X49_12055 [Victivallales bacterium]|nr:hypothetical protein [Victivallales bacterium]